MAVYKVPQDVEADDKLIGPFSFRQFIYLIIVAMAGVLAWFASKLFLPLVIIPLPVIIFFGALALPLRKDQPMEIFMAAMAMFYLKPRRRLWVSDGIESLIEITVPKIAEIQRTKNLSGGEAESRLSYLADIVDSRGWSARGVGVQAPNSAMNSDVYFDALQTTDILDDTASTAKDLSYKLDQSDERRHQEMLDMMKQKLQPTPVLPTTTPDPAAEPHLIFDPYPDMQQTVLQPITYHVVEPPTQVINPTLITSEKPVSPAIINLANNTDLSIETIAREANRIQQSEDEVIISLR